MRYNFDETQNNWQNYKFLLLIPLTLIICTNILFDFRPARLLAINNSIQNDQPIFDESDESPPKTSFFSGLLIVARMFAEIFFRNIDVFYKAIGILLLVSLIKGPTTAIWMHHQLKKKTSKKNQQKINQVELTLSAQAENSQLESDVLNDIQNMNVLWHP